MGHFAISLVTTAFGNCAISDQRSGERSHIGGFVNEPRIPTERVRLRDGDALNTLARIEDCDNVQPMAIIPRFTAKPLITVQMCGRLHYMSPWENGWDITNARVPTRYTRSHRAGAEDALHLNESMIVAPAFPATSL